MEEVSDWECAECGKQLWKRRFEISIADDDYNFYLTRGDHVEFCSKKCGEKWIKENIKLFREDM